MRILTIGAGLVLGLAAVAQAAPLDLRGVPADAKWLAHLDVDAMKASTVVDRACHELIDRWPQGKQGLAMIRIQVGMDLTKDLQGITFYGSQIKKGAGLVVLRAAMDRARLLEHARNAPDYRTSSYGSYTLHSWTRDKGTRREATMAGSFHGESVLVLGPTTADVMAALDVLDGKLPSLAGSDSSLAAGVPEGTAFVARAEDLADAATPVKSPLLRQSRELNVVMGESGGHVFARASLVAASGGVAEQMAKFIEGFRAMAILQSTDQPEAIEMIKMLKVDTDGAMITVAMEMPADEFWGRAQKIRRALEATRSGD